MPNVPPKFQGGQGVPSLDKRTTSGNGGNGGSYDNLHHYYGEKCPVTNGKPWPELKGKVSTGGDKEGSI